MTKQQQGTAEERLRELSVVLCDFLGGGSEWFSRLGDEFYVDPRIVGPELRRRKTDAQITKGALVRANRRLAEMQSDQALFDDICDNMAEVLKPLPGIPDAPGQHAGTRAIEPSDGAGK